LEEAAGKFFNFDFNRQSPSKKSNLAFEGYQILNLAFKGLSKKIEIPLLERRWLANFLILILMSTRSAKIETCFLRDCPEKWEYIHIALFKAAGKVFEF
jgi:hypothetical protein